MSLIYSSQISLPESHPRFAHQETEHQKGNPLFRVGLQAGGRAARRTITSWVPAVQCSSSPATAMGKPLASVTLSWAVLPRGQGSARDPSSGPKSPHCESQDYSMEQKGIMSWCWEERGTCSHGNKASGRSPAFLTMRNDTGRLGDTF